MIRAFACTMLYAAAIQGQTASPERFEVASVKPGDPNAASSGIKTGHGRITASAVTLKRCIMGAYGLGPNQIFGGPDWLDADRFEILAKSDQLTDGDQDLMMKLRTLLAERFQLALHVETRPVQAYVLEVARNGPKMEGAQGGEATTNGNGNGNGRDLMATNATMERFAEILSRYLDLPVVNQTGLPGAFNLKLRWTQEGARPAGQDGTNEAPSIFTALQEQLGLRLQTRKTGIRVLVIDHAEKPAPN